MQLAAAAQRQASERKAILDNLVDMVTVCDAEGRIILVNQAVLLQWGVPPLELVRRPVVDLIDLYRLRRPDGTRLAPSELPLLRVLAGESVVQADLMGHSPTRDRDIYIRTASSPVRDELGHVVGAVSVARDVTEEVEFERLQDRSSASPPTSSRPR